MATISLTIDGQEVSAEKGATILEAARAADIYIPTLCNHPDLPKMGGLKPAEAVWRGGVKIENAPGAPETATGCGLCVVEIAGFDEPQPACATEAEAGMTVTVDSDRLKSIRQEKLIPILNNHPHACLTCAQAEGCSRTQCSSNVPEDERCCPQFGNCELQKLVAYVGIHPSVARWQPTDLPVIKNEPLYERDYNLCINCTRCVRVCQDVRGVGAYGFVFDENGRVVVGALSETMADAGCKFCTACVGVCPTGALMDKGVRPASFEADIVPCKAACPAGIDVPNYVRAIKNGRIDEALAVIRERVPFPGVLGRSCIHPCEDACRRGEVNEPISICALKRFASDNATDAWKEKISVAADTGKRVAVVGSGPAGLTAAFHLRRLGHAVTVFEKAAEPGGMLRYGIPAYRLPDELVAAEIKDILDLGVELRLETEPTAEELKGYDAVFLAIGAGLSRRLDIDGIDSEGVLWGVDFLRAVRTGQGVEVGEKVLVIGGGNVAIDVALTARRLGAGEVTMGCLEKREEMPAHTWEIAEAEEEGVRIINSWGPKAIITQDGRARGVEFMACLAVFDDNGNFNPSYDDCSLKSIEADTIILAIGQASDLSLAQELGLGVSRGLIETGEDGATNVPGVFAGGDAAKAPGSIIEAIAAGRRAAESIDRHLGGAGDISLSLAELGAPDPNIGREDGFAGRPRQAESRLAVTDREGFAEVCQGFDAETAKTEAGRCLQCDLRLTLNEVPSPPEKMVPFTAENLAEAPESEGVYILYDENKEILAIKGEMNLREALEERLEAGSTAKFFEFHEDKMYSKAESELVQAYLQRHGKMPPGDGGEGGGDDLDDLF